MNEQDKIIKEEINLIIKDVIELYNQSGKRTSGRFETLLEAKYEPNKASIYGVSYLAGRKAGKQPPVQAIEDWIVTKGIKPIQDNIKIKSLAWAIAKTIARKGTDEARSLKVYEKIITPERINQIIDKVSEFNVNFFVNELTTSLQLLQKNI